MQNRFTRALISFVCLLSIHLGVLGDASIEDVALQIENLRPESEILHFMDQNTWVGTNGVIVRYGNVALTAETVRVNDLTKVVIAEGAVTLQRDGTYWKGEHLEYNFETNEIKTDEFRAGIANIFVGGVSLETKTTNTTQIAQNAFVTTDDLAEPSFRIRAKSVKVILGKSVEARDATLYLGNVPILWFPYFRRSLEPHARFFVTQPGYRSRFGPYALNKYVYKFDDRFEIVMDLDYRAKRGVGFGPELTYDLGHHGRGNFSYYQTSDRNPGFDQQNVPITEDRYRLKFDYQVMLNTNLTAKASIRKQSDVFTVRDFFEPQYLTNSQPISFVEVNQLWSNLSLDFLAQPQVNNFSQTIERLPDIRLAGARQQLGETPFFYDSDSSFAYLRFRQGSGINTNYAAARGDSYHQLLAPQTYFGWLNLTPRIGGRVTHYSETESKIATFDSENRFVFNTGAEASFKASRILSETKNSMFDVDGLRHIIEPSLNYVFVPEPNVRPNRLPQFDTEIPSLSLLPIDYPDYNQIDSIDSQNVIRMGLRNRIQTKRDGQVVNLVQSALVTDLRLDPNDQQTRLSDIYSSLEFMPRNWVTLRSELRYNDRQHQLNAANHSILLSPNDVWSVRLGQRYFRENLDFGPNSENNTFYDSFYYKFNENWGFRMSHHFEARDGKMEDQLYTIYRDFRSWTGGLTFRLRDYRESEDDFSVSFVISFKTFAIRSLGSDQNKSSLLSNE